MKNVIAENVERDYIIPEKVVSERKGKREEMRRAVERTGPGNGCVCVQKCWGRAGLRVCVCVCA